MPKVLFVGLLDDIGGNTRPGRLNVLNREGRVGFELQNIRETKVGDSGSETALFYGS